MIEILEWSSRNPGMTVVYMVFIGVCLFFIGLFFVAGFRRG